VQTSRRFQAGGFADQSDRRLHRSAKPAKTGENPKNRAPGSRTTRQNRARVVKVAPIMATHNPGELVELPLKKLKKTFDNLENMP